MAMQMEAPAEGEVVEFEEGMTEGHSGPVPLQTLEARTTRLDTPRTFPQTIVAPAFFPTSSFLFRLQMAEPPSPLRCTRAGARRGGE